MGGGLKRILSVALTRRAILRGRKTGWLSLEKTACTLIEICSPSTGNQR
jgi:hypothetical protein